MRPRADVQAVRGISLHVAAGEFFGLLGPERGRVSRIAKFDRFLVLRMRGVWVTPGSPDGE